MSNASKVLARKYRPRNFHELVGQTHVSQALINAIENDRLHHAYLFTGTRGVGKTTIARILAKCLNCERGISSKPCGECNSCTMIDQGRFIDLIEIDAASRTKVEDTRELLDNVPYAPTQGRYKVYLIDEVHMLSTHSFNALLKTLEEPPSHVKFLLATTDPQKLPITIISRCLQFVLRPISQQLLSQHLHNVLTQENIQFDQGALWQLAHSAKGSVRDSLSLTDQAIAFSQGTLTESSINDMLGLISGANLLELIANLYDNDKQGVAQHIEQMRQQMVDANHVFDELAQILHKIALCQILPSIDLNVNAGQAQAISQLSQKISAESLQLYYEIVLKSRETLALATTPMQSLEMCLLRMIAFRPLAHDEFIVDHSEQQQTADNSTEQKYLKEDAVVEVHDLQQDITEKVAKDSDQAPFHEHYSSEQHNADVDPSLPIEPEVEHPQQLSVTDSLDSKIQENIQEVSTVEPTNSAQTNMIQPVIDNSPPLLDTLTETPQSDPNVHSLMNILFMDTDEGHDEDELYNDHDNEDHHEITENPTEQQTIVSPTTTPTTNSSELQIANTPITDTIAVNHQGADPRSLLKCNSQQLTGQWTVEKWDYWVQTSRDKGLLDKDELAFARQGIMTGDCDGTSILYTSLDSGSFEQIFDNICLQLNLEFANAQYTLEKFTTHNHVQDMPQNRQIQREQHAKQEAINQLNQSPVMQKLQQYGPSVINSVKLISDV